MWTEHGVYHYDGERAVFAAVRRARWWPRRLWVRVRTWHRRWQLALAFLLSGDDPEIHQVCVSYPHQQDTRAVLHNVRMIGPTTFTLCETCRSLGPRMRREPTAAERAEAGC